MNKDERWVLIVVRCQEGLPRCKTLLESYLARNRLC